MTQKAEPESARKRLNPNGLTSGLLGVGLAFRAGSRVDSMGSSRPNAARAVARTKTRDLRLPFLMALMGFSIAAWMTGTTSVGSETMLARATAQIEGPRHGGPRAYHAMCARDPKLCMHDRKAGRTRVQGPAAQMTPSLWRQIFSVNMRINEQLTPRDDHELYGVSDYWTPGIVEGDCEDYMILKKQALIAAGWSADQVLYSVVEGTQTPYHAVLIVRTDQGDFVLDNMTDQILPWAETGYRFVVRQSAADPYSWVRVMQDPRLSEAAGLIATR